MSRLRKVLLVFDVSLHGHAHYVRRRMTTYSSDVSARVSRTTNHDLFRPCDFMESNFLLPSFTKCLLTPQMPSHFWHFRWMNLWQMGAWKCNAMSTTTNKSKDNYLEGCSTVSRYHLSFKCDPHFKHRPSSYLVYSWCVISHCTWGKRMPKAFICIIERNCFQRI